MRSMWKVGIAIVAVIVLAGAAVGFVSAQTDNDVPGSDFVARLAEKLGITQEELEEAIDETQLEMVDEAVAQDRLTEEQAERIQERIESGEGLFPFGGFRKGFAMGRGLVHLGAALDDVADFIGISADELRDAMADGQSLAQIAEARAVSVDDLEAFLLSQVEERVAEAVENGGISQEQANQALERAEEQIERLIDQEGMICPQEGPDGRSGCCFPGKFRHYGGFGGPSGPEAEDTAGTTF